MRILVTGGNGVVGKGLVEELRKRGHDVHSLDIVHREDEMGFSPNMAGRGYLRCDVSDYRQIARIFALFPFDLVYHAAAEFGRWNGEDFYETLWRTNVIGTKHIIRLQEELKFKLVHFSSSEVYGDWPDIMTEDVMEDHPVHQLNDYAMTKWVNEMQIRNSARQHGTESVIVRLFNTYGPGEYYSPYRSVNCRFLYCALKDWPWKVYRGHRRTSTYLPDAVRTLANIADKFKAGEVYNIGGDEEHTIEELSERIIAITGADPSLAQACESEPMTTTQKHVDCSKAVRDLDHKATVNLTAGLRLTAEWMRGIYCKAAQ